VAAALEPWIEEDYAASVKGLGTTAEFAILKGMLVVPDAVAAQCQCEPR
jgi:hypothetical protein